jgi:hypothetical protein
VSGHVYADMDAFRRLLSGGDASRDAEMLTVLESSSRAVDAFCNRGSGFGPVHETRTYCTRRHTLFLGGDLIALTSVTIAGDDVDPTPTISGRTRRLTGYRRNVDIEVEGDWSYDYQVVPLETFSGTLAIDATTITPVGTVSPGQTLLLEDEQVLVLSEDEGAVTILRGVNGTAAAAHTDPLVKTFRYDSAAVDATGRIAMNRWRQRDSGITGQWGGEPNMPAAPNQQSEWQILLATVSHLRFLTVDGR